MKNTIRDPVCGMQIESEHYSIDYLQVHYAFCSKQCQERFLANPHLYVGMPGQKAPKQEGLTVIKQRRLRLAQPLSPSQARVLSDALQAMMGIQTVSADGDSVVIAYDLLQATTEQIEEKLAEIGIKLGEGLAERLLRAFVNYEEECELGSLEVHQNKYVHRHPG